MHQILSEVTKFKPTSQKLVLQSRVLNKRRVVSLKCRLQCVGGRGRLHVSNLEKMLPGHVLEQLEHCVRHVLQGAQVDSLIVAKLFGRHVAVIFDDQ